ncbi:MAG: winged helix DNA-binding domain-containing protein [Candidatus Sericytochromatia bacterium]|nr:winged helix DNA-binding domain-containing protein [Candidatus Tanganyikabacteria bacterium]
MASASEDSRKLRAWWAARQGLDGSLQGGAPADILARSGWARSVGGAGPYLTLFSRGGTPRAEADGAVARLAIHELPSARGCTYVLPAADFALGLRLGQSDADMRTIAKLGVTEREIDALCAAVLGALAPGEALDPEGIRERVGGAARSLGEAGKKKGMTTTLPTALGRLQGLGEIRRVPVDGRLDQQRYRYVRWADNPLATCKLSLDECHGELARRYFRWIGPATPAEFQWFSGLGVKAAKAALEPLGLVPVEDGSDRLVFPDDRDAFRDFAVPSRPQYALVSGIDAMNQLRRDVALLTEPAHAAHPLLAAEGRGAGFVVDLPDHAILDRGQLVGLWEFDQAAGEIVWMSFVAPTDSMREAIARTEAFVRDDLGDARAFSLDSPKSRAPRVEALRKASGFASKR